MPARSRLALLAAALIAPLLPGCRSDAPAAPTGEKPPVSELLTDEQLRSPEDPLAAEVDAATVAWIQAHHQPVRSLASNDFSDLEFLKPLLSGKRLVLLGESGHGVSEFSQAKVRLIRFLHEQLGFDVLAFESGTYECQRASDAAATATSLETMRACIFGVWHVQEVLPLFDYIRASRTTTKPLELAGFDIQISSYLGSLTRPGDLRTYVQRVDSAYGARAFALDSAVLERNGAGALSVYAREGGSPLEAAYDSVARFLGSHEAEILRGHAEDSTRVRIMRGSMRGMSAFLREAANLKDPYTSMVVRDTGMARVVDFLADSVYRGRKLVLWAHNYHVRNDGPHAAPEPLLTMGTILARERRPEMYTVGFYMYRGQAASNYRLAYPVVRGGPGSLEAILYRTRRRWAFVDLAGPTPASGNEWIFRTTTAFDWGTTPWRLVPRDQYDGIFFVDTTTPPAYLY